MWKMAAGLVASAVITGAVAGSLADLSVERRSELAQTQASQTPSPQTAPASTKPAQSASVSYAGRNARIKGDRRGHFTTNARMNGRIVEVLVDTGATSVAINKSTARRLGIKLASSDFKHKVNTANGTVKAASAMIDRIEIGRVSVTNVRAAVLPDSSLSSTLLGMTFLNQLRSFEVRSGELVLKQ